MNDLRTHLGTLLIRVALRFPKPFLERLKNCGAGILDENVKVLVPAAKPAHEPMIG